MFKTFAELIKTPLLYFTNHSFEECYVLVKMSIEKMYKKEIVPKDLS
jgi:hypothetical protein